MPDLARAAWLQCMLAQRCVTDKQGRALYQAACDISRSQYDSDQFDDFVHDASTAIGTFGLEIRRMPDPWTGRGMIAVVNTIGDEMAQLATLYTAQEISMIKTMIEMIFTAEHEAYSASTMDLLKQGPKLKPAMPQKAVQDLIDSLVNHGWMHKSESGNVSLSSRGLLELQTYLKDQFPEYLLKCHECQHLLTRGLACAEQDCTVRVHKMCEVIMLSNTAAGRAQGQTCPGCQQAWDPVEVGEEGTQTRNRNRRRRQSRQGTTQATNAEASSDAEEEEQAEATQEEGGSQYGADDDAASEIDQTQSSRRQQQQSRQRKSPVQVKQERARRSTTFDLDATQQSQRADDEEDEEDEAPRKRSRASRR